MRTLKVDDDVHDSLKIYAAINHLSMAECANKAILIWLNEQGYKKPNGKKNGNGKNKTT